MGVLEAWTVSYERGTPVAQPRRRSLPVRPPAVPQGRARDFHARQERQAHTERRISRHRCAHTRRYGMENLFKQAGACKLYQHYRRYDAAYMLRSGDHAPVYTCAVQMASCNASHHVTRGDAPPLPERELQRCCRKMHRILHFAAPRNPSFLVYYLYNAPTTERLTPPALSHAPAASSTTDTCSPPRRPLLTHTRL